ncbi:L-aspartate oxidase [Microbacterium aerolatum]|uniref:L-aspartate oxidase n=1 Tax=Microbacterium aerolatum TaxID=153731 RepID=UPI0020013649|nr:L-aspartate oxidase [Microbacterium aerolatum]MCK3770368.1 L-aspartate oxidase [Microbacterium aerolatum]
MNIVVVGSGIAGLTAALHAADAGHRTTLVTKESLGGGCTALAQGGVAGVYGHGDSPAAHAADTMVAGAGLSDAGAVEVLVRDGSARIAELIARGVAFDRDADGQLLLGREAAHAHARIVHAGGDATGAAISRALVQRAHEADVEVIEHALLVDLLVDESGVHGIRILRDDLLVDIHADAVILATGGAGQLYAHTTNPDGATGDGIAAAIRAGAAVADLEFVQFHPTVLVAGLGDAFLISEAVRGEGAALLDDEGRRFVFDVHPDGELAPRDVVARAVAQQAALQGSPVRLDATMIGAARLAVRFPTIDRVTRERGFDWAREPIPVTPAAHYLMGGVVTDLDGSTSVPGLFAAGEVARTGVHGANRLASNSLLEAAVFGARAVAAAGRGAAAEARLRLASLAHPVSSPAASPPPLNDPQLSSARSDLPMTSPRGALSERIETKRGERAAGESKPPFSREHLQHLMWDHVGLLRSPDGVTEALDTIRIWRAAAPAPTTRAEHEDANLLLVAEATASAALTRRESVGAHHLDHEPALIGA